MIFQRDSNIVESNMSRLRAALLDLGCDPIEAQWGAGYIQCSEQCL
jgi:two-component system OmpR family response regulator